jgi:predicted TIM-barrel fold metal-dependent hydrolase
MSLLHSLLVLSLLVLAYGQITLDAHVHITDPTKFTYTWANSSSTEKCPAAPPTLCKWTTKDWVDAMNLQPAVKYVFVEVAVIPSQWLEEATWVQGLADAGDNYIGGIVAQPPPGFGTTSGNITAITAGLDALIKLPLARGVRASAVNWTDASSMATVIEHTKLLSDRNLSFDIITSVNQASVQNILQVTRAVPSVTFIINHAGSPPVLGTTADIQDWKEAMDLLGKETNIYCKVGGIMQYYKPREVVPTSDEVTPFTVDAIKAFGYKRSIYEANWFFVNWAKPKRLDMAGIWQMDIDLILLDLDPTDPEQEQFFAKAGADAYRVTL